MTLKMRWSLSGLSVCTKSSMHTQYIYWHDVHSPTDMFVNILFYFVDRQNIQLELIS